MNASWWKRHVKSRVFPWVFAGLGLLILGSLLTWVSRPSAVAASGGDLTRFTNKYPAANNTRLDACSLCHTTAPALNAYGSAYKSHGRNTVALTAIESLDSDGDGWTNLQEINALTFPGNANDHPAGSPAQTSTPLPTPTRTSTVGVAPSPTPAVSATPGPIGGPPIRLYLPMVDNAAP